MDDAGFFYFFDFLVNGMEELFSLLEEVSEFFRFLFTLVPSELMFIIILLSVLSLLGLFFRSLGND